MHTGGFNMAWLRGGIGATVFAGLVLGLVPYAIRSVGNSDTPRTEGWPAVAALAMIGLGLAVCARCVWDFARTGRGTPVPFDPPRRHVRVGLYGWVRNPMYLGCLLVLLGQAALFWSRGLLAYTCSSWYMKSRRCAGSSATHTGNTATMCLGGSRGFDGSEDRTATCTRSLHGSPTCRRHRQYELPHVLSPLRANGMPARESC